MCVGLVPGERAPESYPGRVGQGPLRGLGAQASAGMRGRGPGRGGRLCGPSAAGCREKPTAGPGPGRLPVTRRVPTLAGASCL